MAKIDKGDYLDQWKTLTRLEAGGYRAYSKAILLLSSGAFVLAHFTLSNMHGPNYIYFLVYAWLFWIITILLQLASFSLYPKALHQEKIQLETLQKDPDKKLEPNYHYAKMQQMSLLSTAGFGMGAFFFIIFVLFNLNCF